MGGHVAGPCAIHPLIRPNSLAQPSQTLPVRVQRKHACNAARTVVGREAEGALGGGDAGPGGHELLGSELEGHVLRKGARRREQERTTKPGSRTDRLCSGVSGG